MAQVCLRILSVPRCEQFSKGEARGKLWASRENARTAYRILCRVFTFQCSLVRLWTKNVSLLNKIAKGSLILSIILKSTFIVIEKRLENWGISLTCGIWLDILNAPNRKIFSWESEVHIILWSNDDVLETRWHHHQFFFSIIMFFIIMTYHRNVMFLHN